MTLEQYCRKSRQRLAPRYDSDEAAMLMRIIFEYLKGWSHTDMVIRATDPLSDFIISKADAIVERLLTGEPIQYILGEARFYGLKFRVNPSTLIPRPETEQLVDRIVSDVADTPDLRILDLCTGSGCIAIALARNLRFPQIEGIDISAEALEVARRNATMLRAPVSFRQADVISLPPGPGSYDIIVSNPPYVALSERSLMSDTVLDYEPHAALFVPDANPLLFYRAISRLAIVALKPGGSLYFEINPLFADALRRMLLDDGWSDVELWADFRKHIRFLKARKP